MTIPTAELIRLERLHVRAWPARETATVDGWLWRYSGGGSKRANSVSTVAFAGVDPAAALDTIEARYRARGAPAHVHTFDAGAPARLAELLAARGYRCVETTTTMMKRLAAGAPPPDVESADHAGDAWRAVYFATLSEDRRAGNARILDHVPAPRRFFACRRDDRVISTALGVADDGMAVIECVATRAEARGRGGAQAVLRALEAWAAGHGVDTLGLQVVATNQPALALYRRLGFAAIGINRFWRRD